MRKRPQLARQTQHAIVIQIAMGYKLVEQFERQCSLSFRILWTLMLICSHKNRKSLNQHLRYYRRETSDDPELVQEASD